MNLAIQLVVYLLVGLVEMFLVTQRTYCISKGNSWGAASTVFVENLIVLFVFYNLLTSIHSNWPVIIAYSLGGSIGTLINIEKF
jgi:hypothetical protein